MGVLDRIAIAVKTNISARLEVDVKIAQLRQNLSQSMAVLKRKEAEYNLHIFQLQEWEMRSLLALQNGDENLARENLIHNEKYVSLAKNLKSELDLQLIQVDTVKKDLTAIEDKLSQYYRNSLCPTPVMRQNDVKYEVDPELELLRYQIQSGALPLSGSPKPSDDDDLEALPRQMG